MNEKIVNEDNQIHNFISSPGSGTVISYRSGSGSDFLTSYGSGSTSQKVTVPTVPVPQHWLGLFPPLPSPPTPAARLLKELIPVERLYSPFPDLFVQNSYVGFAKVALVNKQTL